MKMLEDRANGEGLLCLTDDELRTVRRNSSISDVYDVEDTVFARGKFATVRRANHKTTGVQYAAKYIKKRRRAVDMTPEIYHEISVLRKCAPCGRVVRLHEVYETNSDVVLVLELAAGGELQRIFDADHCLNEVEARRAMRQILEGLSYLHERNIAHLDLKPQNLLLTVEDSCDDIKLCDFGVSRLLAPGAEVRALLGTPDYVAPEVLSYEPISLATDIWSVGVLAYVLLSGYTPFGADTKQQTYLNISQCMLTFEPDHFGDVSTAAIDFIKSSLLVNPRLRPSVQDLLQHPWISPKSHILPSLSIKTTEPIGTTPKTTPISQQSDSNELQLPKSSDETEMNDSKSELLDVNVGKPGKRRFSYSREQQSLNVVNDVQQNDGKSDSNDNPESKSDTIPNTLTILKEQPSNDTFNQSIIYKSPEFESVEEFTRPISNLDMVDFNDGNDVNEANELSKTEDKLSSENINKNTNEVVSLEDKSLNIEIETEEGDTKIKKDENNLDDDSHKGDLSGLDEQINIQNEVGGNVEAGECLNEDMKDEDIKDEMYEVQTNIEIGERNRNSNLLQDTNEQDGITSIQENNSFEETTNIQITQENNENEKSLKTIQEESNSCIQYDENKLETCYEKTVHSFSCIERLQNGNNLEEINTKTVIQNEEETSIKNKTENSLEQSINVSSIAEYVHNNLQETNLSPVAQNDEEEEKDQDKLDTPLKDSINECNLKEAIIEEVDMKLQSIDNNLNTECVTQIDQTSIISQKESVDVIHFAENQLQTFSEETTKQFSCTEQSQNEKTATIIQNIELGTIENHLISNEGSILPSIESEYLNEEESHVTIINQDVEIKKSENITNIKSKLETFSKEIKNVSHSSIELDDQTETNLKTSKKLLENCQNSFDLPLDGIKGKYFDENANLRMKNLNTEGIITSNKFKLDSTIKIPLNNDKVFEDNLNLNNFEEDISENVDEIFEKLLNANEEVPNNDLNLTNTKVKTFSSSNKREISNKSSDFSFDKDSLETDEDAARFAEDSMLWEHNQRSKSFETALLKFKASETEEASGTKEGNDTKVASKIRQVARRKKYMYFASKYNEDSNENERHSNNLSDLHPQEYEDNGDVKN